MAENALTFIHFTDTHVQAPEKAPLMGMDTNSKMQAAIDAVRKFDLNPAFIVISGDLTHEADEAGYVQLKKYVDELATLGGQVLLSLGNHDRRLPFRAVFMNQHDVPETEPIYHSTMIDGLRVIVLDTHVVGTHDGELDEAQLTWLANELEQPAPRGNLIVLHHPPAPNLFVALASHLLKNADQFWDVVAGKHVVGVLSGHIHFHSVMNVRGIPSVTGTGVAFVLDPTQKEAMCMLDGSGFNILTLINGEMVTTPIMLPGEQTEKFRMTFAQIAEMQAQRATSHE